MTNRDLATQICLPCKGGVPPLDGETLRTLHAELGADWVLAGGHHLEKEFRFDGYSPAVAFTNAIATIASEQNHHPDILLAWGRVKVSIWTHKIDGLTESDFVFAAKVQRAWERVSG